MNLISYLSDERGRAKRLASLLGVTPTTIHEWAHRKKPVPPKRCPEVERVTGGAVTRRDLRPDDWHLIWPELAERRARLGGREDTNSPQEAA